MSSSRFRKFIPFVHSWETVYAKGHYGDDRFALVERDPADSGGTTKFGLDAATHGEGVEKLTWTEAEAVYCDWYWCGRTHSGQWVSCESLPPLLGEVVFDTRINSGMGIARRFLAFTSDPKQFLYLRDCRNKWLAEQYPKNLRFLQGWLNRTAALRKELRLS